MKKLLLILIVLTGNVFAQSFPQHSFFENKYFRLEIEAIEIIKLGIRVHFTLFPKHQMLKGVRILYPRLIDKYGNNYRPLLPAPPKVAFKTKLGKRHHFSFLFPKPKRKKLFFMCRVEYLLYPKGILVTPVRLNLIEFVKKKVVLPKTILKQKEESEKISEEKKQTELTISTLPQLPQYDNYIALIVGVSHYKNIAHLPYPEKDIELMKEVVTKIMGVKKKNLYVIKNPTKAEIIVHIKKITRLANNYKNPKVIFYFSGHGTTYTEKEGKGEGYLLPIEADPEDIPTTALALAEVEKLLGEVKGEKVVIIDACFSGKGKSILPAGKPFIGIKKITPKIEYTTILLSSEENEISTYIKDKGISTFTYALYEMMAKYGPVLDENKNGWLEVKEIAKKLEEFTNSYALKFASQHQHPVVRGNLNISLAQCP
ncbi:MAG: caspase family protein [Candidatus Desulfofervidus auxilii]|nr:caspase family protein [Candidatus Desulfofervidus auxilii]